MHIDAAALDWDNQYSTSSACGHAVHVLGVRCLRYVASVGSHPGYLDAPWVRGGVGIHDCGTGGGTRIGWSIPGSLLGDYAVAPVDGRGARGGGFRDGSHS